MNYYERHLGDYAKKTLHLSMMEHGAYNILLDLYYDTESGIPADKVYRLARARTKEEKQAVDSVLGDFFELIDGVWINHRAEEEITKYNDGEPEREVKKANETNRLKRHREERANLFRKLTAAGQHASWNISINELREMVKRLDGNAPETDDTPLPETAPATPATATQTPDTRHQTPVLKTGHQAAVVNQPPPGVDQPAAARDPVQVRALELVQLLRGKGAAIAAGNVHALEWAKAGVTDAVALTALEVAERRRADAGSVQPVNAGLLNSIIIDGTAPPGRGHQGTRRNGSRDGIATAIFGSATAAEPQEKTIEGERVNE